MEIWSILFSWMKDQIWSELRSVILQLCSKQAGYRPNFSTNSKMNLLRDGTELLSRKLPARRSRERVNEMRTFLWTSYGITSKQKEWSPSKRSLSKIFPSMDWSRWRSRGHFKYFRALSQPVIRQKTPIRAYEDVEAKKLYDRMINPIDFKEVDLFLLRSIELRETEENNVKNPRIGLFKAKKKVSSVFYLLKFKQCEYKVT